MQTDPAERAAMYSKLTSEIQGVPPAEVVLAASALTIADQIGTVHIEFKESGTSSRWLVIAIVGQHGLLVIDAAEDSSGWDAQSGFLNRLPERFSAELIGFDRIEALEVAHVRDINVPHAPASRWQEAQWAVQIHGRPAPLMFPLNSGYNFVTAAMLAREIAEILAGTVSIAAAGA